MSDEKDEKNKSLTVRDNRGGILESSLANLPPDKREKIIYKAAEAGLNLTIEAQGKQNQSGLAMDELKEVLTTFEDVPRGKGTFTSVSGEFKTGSGRVNIQAKKCFIATIAFDSPEAEEVCCLRAFHDNLLCNYKLGIRFIDWYYRNGPKLATIVGRYQSVKWLVRKMLSIGIYIWKAIQ